MIQLRSGAASDVGKVRQTNQDQALQAEVLFAVADGVGGHAGGETASLMAVETLARDYAGKRSSIELTAAVHHANTVIWEKSLSDTSLRGMGTTLCALALIVTDGSENLAVVNVGDSRAYVMVSGHLRQITQDHSLVEEMVRGGELSPQEAAIHPKRHIVTRALGIEPDVKVDLWEVAPHAGERYLLCSDGLTNEVSDSEMASVLTRDADPTQAARQLVSLARAHGGSDNITAVIIDIAEVSGSTTAGLNDPSGSGQGAESGSRQGAGAGAGAGSKAADPAGGPVAPGERASGPRGSGPAVGDTTMGLAAPGPTSRGATRDRPRRRITPRVTIFVAAVMAVIAGAVGLVIWYAEHSYYVGLDTGQVTIYKGQVGGFLWVKPTVAKTTSLYATQVLPSRLDDLRRGMPESSLGAAQAYVANLRSEARGITNPTTPSSYPLGSIPNGSTTSPAGGSTIPAPVPTQ